MDNQHLKTRIFSADLIKVISIFAVVYIHSNNLFIDNLYVGYFLRDTFRFAVPAFIIIWSNFLDKSYSKKNNRERRKYIYRRFKYLFGVFFFWSTIYFIITANWEAITFKNIITKHFTGYGFAGQYYFIILFQLLLLYPLILWSYKKKFLRYSICLIVGVIYLIWNYKSSSLPQILLNIGYRPFIFWIPYVYTGIALARNDIPKILIIWSIFIFLIPVESYIIRSINPTPTPYISISVLIGSILSTITTINSTWVPKKKNITKLFEYLGKNTMIIFVTNPLIILLLEKADISILLTSFKAFYVLISFIVVSFILITCLLINIVINKSKLKGLIN